MIKKVKVGDEYHYYDNVNLLFKVNNGFHYNYILTKLNNIFYIYYYEHNMYFSLFGINELINPDILYKFEPLHICYVNGIYYILDSNFDIFMVTYNLEYDMIKYAIKKLRKEKLKLLI